MTTEAGTPALNKPVPDRSEYQRRCEEALEVAERALETGPRTEFISSNNPEAAFSLYRASLIKIAAILEDR